MDDSVTDDITTETNGPALETPPIAAVAIEEASEPIEASDPGDENDAVEPPKPDRRSIQAKIDKSVAAQRSAERERDELKARIDALEKSRPAETKKAEPSYTRPKPSENDIGTKYKGYPEYVEDLTDWKLEQRDAAQAESNARRAVAQRHEAHATQFSTRIAKAEEADPEFWTKISPAIANLRPSTVYDPAEMAKAYDAARRGHPQAQRFLGETTIADIIFDSEYSTELMAHLSANTQEFQRLSTLPMSQLTREMGRLEAQVMRPVAAQPGPAPKTPISSAPAPIKPVGTTASTSTTDPMSEDLDVDEHIKVMNARDKKGRFVR